MIMKQKNYLLSVVFTATLTLALLGGFLARLVYPLVILPQWNIPNLVALSAVALVVGHWLAPDAKRNYLLLFLFAALSCALLPWAAGWTHLSQMPLCGLSGGLVFTATAWAYSSITDRLSTGPAAKSAPILAALGLYLAAQCFQGIGL